MKDFIADSISLTDTVAWALTAIFFCTSALLFGGDLAMAFIGAGGVIVTMFLVGAAIEVIIEILKNVKGFGTLVGFITNGPEALVLIVGLLVGDILFAASTPLGSNIMNPLLLFTAALLTARVGMVWRTAPGYLSLAVILTATLAVGFFALPEGSYWIWLLVTLPISLGLFLKRPEEHHAEPEEVAISRGWLLPAVAVLLVAGYFLDPVVSFASEASLAPKGVIGFLVLSTLTSWPEFKSTMALLRRNLTLAAVLNIVVSNITNLWLAAGGVAIHLLL